MRLAFNFRLFFLMALFAFQAIESIAASYSVPTVCNDHVFIELKTLADNKKQTNFTEPACSYSEHPYALISKKCAPNLDLCLEQIYLKNVELQHWEPIGQYGNPTFQLCSYLGGDPQFVRYNMPKKRLISTTVCIFKSENIVTDLDSLYASYLRRVRLK